VVTSVPAASLCRMIADMLEDSEGGEAPQEIELNTAPYFTKQVLALVFEFCEFLLFNGKPNIKKPIREDNLYNITLPWYASFAEKLDEDTLCSMLLAANFLNQQDLLDLLSARLCMILRNKTVEEVRAFFRVINDYTDEEIKEVVRQNKQAREAYSLPEKS